MSVAKVMYCQSVIEKSVWNTGGMILSRERHRTGIHTGLLAGRLLCELRPGRKDDYTLHLVQRFEEMEVYLHYPISIWGLMFSYNLPCRDSRECRNI